MRNAHRSLLVWIGREAGAGSLCPKALPAYPFPKAACSWLGLPRFSKSGKRCSIAAREISISSSASSGVKAPTVTMSWARMAFQETVSPTYGEQRPAARALMVISGCWALWMMEATDSISTCIKKPMQLKIWM